ncbi:MAG TPA: acetoacetate--CoA ligase [Ilumatobacter sp.]|nr:acetoacetate--CoA ligase [Ilumatobacter sp.]
MVAMGHVLWEPSSDARATTRLGAFMDLCEQRSGRAFADYSELWEWSVGDGLTEMWAAVWEYFDVVSDTPYSDVLQPGADGSMLPGAQWFVGSRVNYAAQALRWAGERGEATAVVGLSQSRGRQELTWAELAEQVGAARRGLVELGVGEGDRVAAYLPNLPETIVAFLATASLGAIWTSCAPEFGVQAVLDRFAQIEPKVLFVVDGYQYGAKSVQRHAEVAAVRAGLPTLQHTVLVPYLDAGCGLPDAAIAWGAFLGMGGSASGADDEFRCLPVAPDHPLYVLYSSGTTGLPKAIVHGHGGIMLEHLKCLGLHGDMGPNDRFFWFTTTGWMMWNYLVSGLLVGARVVVFDGDPNADGPETLWQLAADEGVTWFGVGAPFLTASQRAGVQPGSRNDLSRLRAVGATGAPLPPEGFRFVYEQVSPKVLLSPISGGTDVCSAFVGGNPLTPVWEGEIPARYLGAAVRSFGEDGEPHVGEQGELVIAQPMPSMPVGFWGDTDGSKYREAYFEHIPGVWRHGDWITITDRGSCVISGRSDATLNRGGVRVGTAEIYRVVESVEGVVDSLVVHLEPDVLVLFVALADGVHLDEPLLRSISAALRSGLSPRHVPDECYEVSGIPTTLSGKKLELPVKKVLLGAVADAVASRDSLKNPAALDEITEIAANRPTN